MLLRSVLGVAAEVQRAHRRAMNLRSILRVAAVALWRNRTRSLLTVLGILIGIASVVMVTSLSSAASERIGGQFDAMGTNAIFVSPKEGQQGGRRARGRLSELDARAIQAGAPSVKGVAPFLSTRGEVTANERTASTLLIGTRIPYFEIRNFEVARGALWDATDEALKTRVCVIGGKLAERLFEGQDPLGRTIRVARFPFRIIGVLKRKDNVNFLADEDDRLLMPIGSFRGRVLATSPERVDVLHLSATSSDTVDRATAQATEILRARHRIEAGGENDFRISSQSEFREKEQAIFGVLAALLVAVAATSLFVGGVGVMNIMLVSVTERTREIGIRMALGARPGEIQRQFLLEAIVLSLAGGALGSITGLVGSFVLGFVLDWKIVPNYGALAVALVTSAFVGVIFGLLPARRAARLDPIEALRVE